MVTIYRDNRHRKKELIVLLTLRFGNDIAPIIYKFYESIFRQIQEDHVYMYQLLKPNTSVFFSHVDVIPYHTSEIIPNYKSYLEYYKQLKYKKYTMMIITMAGHSDFVSKTSNDLVSRRLRNVHRIHREGCSIRELEQLVNCEKQAVTQRKRIEILESIADAYKTTVFWMDDYFWHSIYDKMYLLYLDYLNLDVLLSPGYILDSQNSLFGLI